MGTTAPLQRKTRPLSVYGAAHPQGANLHSTERGRGWALFSQTPRPLLTFKGLLILLRRSGAQVIPGQCPFFTGESHREPALYLSSESRPPLPPWSLFIQINFVQPGTLFWSSDFGSRFNAPRKWTVRAPGSARIMTLGRAQGRVRRFKHGNQNFAFAVVSLAWR